MDWSYTLIRLFLYVCQKYSEELWVYNQRMSNNKKQRFTDEEIITIYLFGIIQKRFKVKQIYQYTKDHLGEWFPDLPSYPAFIQRLNKLDSLFMALTEHIINDFNDMDILKDVRLVDSMPIFLANEKRSSRAKVAKKEIANKGYCGSKSTYYHGVKLHVIAFRNPHKLPVPEYIGISSGSNDDRKIFKQVAPYISNSEIYGDKGYVDGPYNKHLSEKQNVDMYIPVKKKKGQKHLELFDKFLSTSISEVRQPIESLFSWLDEKTNIQSASKVRSYKGLLVHVFGKLSAAMFILLNT